MNSQTTNSNYIQYIRVFFIEAHLHRRKAIACFSVASLLTLLVGLFYPQEYQSSATIFADQQNIIKPLLAGKAAVTKVQDRARVVREVITSPRLLKKVVAQEVSTKQATPEEIERQVNNLRGAIKVAGLGGNYIRISYKASDPDKTHRIVSAVADLFINDSSERKRNESREAYQFIDRQVKEYKSQLQSSEDRLKEFSEQSRDGTEGAVNSRISKLRSDIETIQLSLDDGATRVQGIEAEMESENRYLDKRFKSDVYRNRLLAMQQELETLTLVYTETYPDIVTLKHQIEDMKNAINEVADESETLGSSEGSESSDSDLNLNPLYEKLRSTLSSEKVELKAKQRRLGAMQALLQEEYARLKRVAARQAELAELSRDYRVIKTIYEDMLGRKEKARLSMTLDIEGQGVNYKIQEPASYPLTPEGLRFVDFVLLGPLVGLLVPLGLIIVYMQIDSRVRFRERLEASIDVPILSEIPHLYSPTEKRGMRNEYMMLMGFVVLALIGYAGIVLLKIGGLLL